jgi:hypothetical protein
MGEHFASMTEDDWGTPIEIADCVREFYGVPDLDPASDEFRNQTIKAKRILGEAQADPVHGIPIAWGQAKTVFINPPGGMWIHPDLKAAGAKRGPSFVELFWSWSIQHLVAAGDGAELIWVAYNINQLQTLQQANASALALCSICVPSSRVKYLDKTGTPKGGTPSASAIVCLSTREDAAARFAKAFGGLGMVWAPASAMTADDQEAA